MIIDESYVYLPRYSASETDDEVPQGASVLRVNYALVHWPFDSTLPGIGTFGAVAPLQEGTVVMDAWLEFAVAFNGTTPKGDVGLSGIGNFLNFIGALYTTTWFDATKVGGFPSVNEVGTVAMQSAVAGIRGVPYALSADASIGVTITSTGQSGGTADSTAGRGTLYALLAVPV